MAGLLPGIVLGAVLFLAVAGLRHAGGGNPAALEAELSLLQTQWRLAEISRERIEKDYLVSLDVYKVHQQSGNLNVSDRIASIERAIAGEKTKIAAAVDEMVAVLLPLAERFRRDARLLDRSLADAQSAGGSRGFERLTQIKTMLQQAPPERDRRPAYFKETVARLFTPDS